MGPYCEQTGHSVTSRNVDQAATTEVAAPEINTPSPSPTPPPPPPEQPAGGGGGGGVRQVHAIPVQFNMNPLPVMQHGAPDFLPIDHNLPQLLRQVTGTDNLGSVEVLKLRVIAREMSLQRLCLYLPNLHELNFDGSCLGSLRDLGCGLTSLQVLRVTRCGLESLDGTFGLTSLQELHAGNNQIEDVGPCSSLPHIRVLDVHRNPIWNISYVGFLSICTHLESLVMQGCPVVMQANYRATIRRLLPQLINLDGELLNIESHGDGVVPETLELDDSDDDEDRRDGDDRLASNSPIAQRRIDSIRRTNTSPRKNIPDGSQDGMATDSVPSVSDDDSSAVSKASSPSSNSTSSAYQGSADSPQSSFVDSATPETKQKQRPSTALSCEGQHRVFDSYISRRERPATAGPTSSPDTGEDETSVCLANLRSDSPSILTSGIVVCGNLTAALRGRRKRLDAWGEQQGPHKQKQVPLSKTPTIQESPVEQIETGDGQHIIVEDVTDEAQDELLEASRRWRQLYASYRTENRARWEKETFDEDKSLGKDKKQESNTECQKKVVRRTQEKLAPPCCSKLFASNEKASESSYDADTSSNIDVSPDTANINRRKKGLRGHIHLL